MTDSAPTLTRTEQVMDVLKAGGALQRDGRSLRLVDAQGRDVPAWRTAIKLAQARWALEGRTA